MVFPIVSRTQVRVQVHIPTDYRGEPILARLALRHGLTFNILAAALDPSSRPGIFDLELRGSVEQIRAGLEELRSLHLGIMGKANPDGDSWHY
ncbi:NIL domain-containing protein [Geitlerinema sp. PCC 7407]|uniref:NIL domain-containing protein n=1 Tax=Geitlerinema sp. PCC 7407 TaxID=1173025 RepID=UPI00029FCD14|nr:NIL domain-containing protein [Geitlerinema sp. PCC 7407]AFY66544.1 NIL domain protein [Geitlerinema sp. PCC 7407]